jgi:2-amino-4-hydroxy-6-hydroxymethyldihydropteridine diphosphokinase
MNHAYLLTGGNLGDRAGNLKMAAEAIGRSAGKIVMLSSLYETAAWGTKDQPDYLNQAIEIETNMRAPELLNILLDIEIQLGRYRQEKYGPRLIDIDILFFNSDILKTPNLVIPHPHIQNRRFVLVPMAEIASDFQHPVFNKSITELLTNCTDPLNVKKFCSQVAIKQVDLP